MTLTAQLRPQHVKEIPQYRHIFNIQKWHCVKLQTGLPCCVSKLLPEQSMMSLFSKSSSKNGYSSLIVSNQNSNISVCLGGMMRYLFSPPFYLLIQTALSFFSVACPFPWRSFHQSFFKPFPRWLNCFYPGPP